jgi:hypothetical protein
MAVLLVSIGLTGPTASAQDENEATGYGRLQSDQDLWSGPSTNFKVLDRIEAGTLLEILVEKGDYLRVRVPGGFPCYISAEFIAYGQDMVGTVTGNRVNLRSIPSLEGDYPILKVDRGTTLDVWERKGSWVRVTAPPEAYAYVLKTAVTPVESTPEVLMQVDAQRLEGRRAWEDHIGGITRGRQVAKQETEIDARFKELEAIAASDYAGKDLAEVKIGYESIRDATSDEVMRKVIESRIREIDALIASKKLQDNLKELEKRTRLREERMRQDMKRLEDERDGGGTGESGSRVLPKGKRLVVLGRVDAAGNEIMLRGGRVVDDPLYYISCPDKRYALEDFHGKRIAVRGSIEQMITGELPRIRVERIEIMN